MLSFQLGENLLGRNLHVKVLRTRNKESFIVGYFLGDIHVYSSTLSLQATSVVWERHYVQPLLPCVCKALCRTWGRHEGLIEERILFNNIRSHAKWIAVFFNRKITEAGFRHVLHAPAAALE